MYLIDLEFKAQRPILSLPSWHGARWSAWLRFAARESGCSLEEIIAGIYVFRHGTAPIRPCEFIRLRLLVIDAGLFLLPGLIAALKGGTGHGEFSPLTLALTVTRDALSGQAIWEAGKGPVGIATLFEEKAFEAEINALLQMRQWTLQFTSPLRLPLEAGNESRGQGEAKFARAETFSSSGALLNLLNRARFITSGRLVSINAEIVSARLKWDDMRYNAERRIALGGLVGSMTVRAQADFELARRAVLGQYLGAGKNARFGLGFWRIPELDHTLPI